LFSRVVRDRPGILFEMASILRSRGVNIRNVVGNSHALMLEVEGDVDLSIIYEVRRAGVLSSPPHLTRKYNPWFSPGSSSWRLFRTP
jgi:hypothetical protein